MKKLLIVSLILILQTVLGSAQRCCAYRGTPSHQQEYECCSSSFIDQFSLIESKIRMLYANKVFATGKNSHFKMEEICTESFLCRLANAYEYDGKGYATWLLRSGLQDSEIEAPSEILNVVPGAHDTVIVYWTDLGVKGSTTFTMVESGGCWKIDNATVPEGFSPL